MPEHDDIVIKTEADRDSVKETQYLLAFVKIAIPISLPLLVALPPLKAILIAIGLGLVGSVITVKFSEKIGRGVHILYGGGKASYTTREQLQGTLKAVKVAKMNNNYKLALSKVNNVLDQDPDNPEAHFYKAQILHEEFSNPDGAKKHLRFALSHSKPGETIHTWASSLLGQLESKLSID